VLALPVHQRPELPARPPEPEHTPPEPEPIPPEPEHIPPELEHIPSEPEHTPLEPELTLLELEHTPPEPEPIPLELEHTPLEPEPLRPELTLLEPELTLLEPELTPPEPEHTPPEPQHTRAPRRPLTELIPLAPRRPELVARLVPTLVIPPILVCLLEPEATHLLLLGELSPDKGSLVLILDKDKGNLVPIPDKGKANPVLSLDKDKATAAPALYQAVVASDLGPLLVSLLFPLLSLLSMKPRARTTFFSPGSNFLFLTGVTKTPWPTMS